MKWLARGALGLLSVIGVGTTAAVGDQFVSGGSWTTKLVGGIKSALGLGQNDASGKVGYDWIGTLIEYISKLIKQTIGENGLTNSLDRLSSRMTGKPLEEYDDYEHVDGSKPGAHAQHAPGNDLKSDADGNTPGGGPGSLIAGGATAATFGAGALALGGRAIPVAGAAVAVAEGAYDVTDSLSKGEYKKAFVRAVSTVPDAAGCFFGPLGFAAGVAGRELVENFGEAALGKEAHIEDSVLAGATKGVAKWAFGIK
ncbi:MAG: hypothetical protein DI551_04230 [Micavibrio aeruginosavorus]|uniref:DUF637 domain-containing protein n=1 Tax=Micavibrio aeruginosavorus TaxID=349221 RepID=A0A2W5PWR2_9BACT|nr:MAG: hypothetical protein DI551_04230 [Micavibrio aeruginosavorus]